MMQRRKPAIFDYEGQIYGPKCNNFLGCTCNIMDKYSIKGYGNANARVMLIGIAPGRQEEIWGVPLVGPSGDRNDKCLRVVKYPREKVYASNLICWRNDVPTTEEIAACWPRLRAEIQTVRPRLIVALGALACEWLTGYSIGKVRGNLIRPEYNRSEHFRELGEEWPLAVSPEGRTLSAGDVLWSGPRFGGESGDDDGHIFPLPTILPTWHPAATLRIGSLATDVIRDYMKIRRFLKGQLEPPNWKYTVVRNKADAQDVLNNLAGRTVAIDVETEKDLSDSFGKIICVAVAIKWDDEEIIRLRDGTQIGHDYQAWVFPVEVLRGLKWPKSVKWLEHNMQFDNPAIYKEFGIWLPGVYDTMLDSWSRDERPGRDEDSTSERSRSGEDSKPKGPGYHGLKQLSAEYCGSEPGYGDEMKKSFGKTLEEIAAPQLIPLEVEEIAREGGPAWPLKGATPSEQQKVAVELLPGVGVGTMGGNVGDGARDKDLGSPEPDSSALTTPVKAKGRKAKPKIPMRMETPEEAATRFALFLEALHKYNAFDAINTVMLPSRLPGRSCPAYETIIMPAARAYARIHMTGIPVDLDRVRELQEEWEPWIKNLEAELQEEAYDLGFRNPPKLKRDQLAKALYEEEHGEGAWMGEPINLGSSLQLGKLLFGILRLPVKVKSKKTGKPSVGKEAIAQINHPFVDRMEEVRTAKHVKGSHLDPIPDLVKGDGRLHANIWVNGAVNYRRSITKPPLQQYPKEHPKEFWKRLAEVRSVIRADPGFCLIEADYKQIELWGAALLSGDPVFLADMHSGDYHTRIVRDVFHCDEDVSSVVFDHTRRIAKSFNFAVIYRVEGNTLAKTMNEGAQFGRDTKPVTPNQAERLIRQWYARNRVFWAWQEELIREVRRTGKLINPLGEIRRFPLYDTMLDKQIVNWPVSSTCGAHSEISCVELEPIIRKELGGSVLFDTHDSLLVHVPIKKRTATRRIMQEIMEEPKVPGWPSLGVDFKISTTTWRDMHDWKE